MERIDLATLEEILGIQPPWHITSFELDRLSHTANVKIDNKDKKKLFGLLDHSPKSDSLEQKVTGRWFYAPVGGFKCMIHADVPVSNSPVMLDLAVLNAPAFLGHPNRNYSNYLRQQVALADIKGMGEQFICEAYNISPEVYKTIKTDLEAASVQARSLAFLPTENDSAWRDVLNDQIHIKTSVLPLKLMLSKLKLATAKSDSSEQIANFSKDLRQFFMANAHLLDDEVNQVCRISSEKMRRQVSATKQRQRLVLPALKNPVWIDLLTGKLNLNSQSIPLNLLVSRQRVAFLQGKDSATRIAAIDSLREYVKKNHRALKPELVLINRAISINEKTNIRLPNPDHEIWQKILYDNDFIPSQHVAYKLLLAKLRVQVQVAEDPVVKLEAARSIRSFMQQNQKALQRELNDIVKQSTAV